LENKGNKGVKEHPVKLIKIMKNLEHVNRLIGHLKSKTQTLDYMLSRQEPVSEFRKVLEDINTKLDDIEFEINK